MVVINGKGIVERFKVVLQNGVCITSASFVLILRIDFVKRNISLVIPVAFPVKIDRTIPDYRFEKAVKGAFNLFLLFVCIIHFSPSRIDFYCFKINFEQRGTTAGQKKKPIV